MVRSAQLGDNVSDSRSLGLDRAAQWVAAEGAKAHPPRLRGFASEQRQAVVIDHNPNAVAPHHRARLREIQRYHRDGLELDVLPHIELGPVRQRKHPHRLARAQPRIIEPPQFRALTPRVPDMAGTAERKDSLLRPALLLVAPRPAQGGIKTVLV